MRSATQGRTGRGLPVSVTLAGDPAGIRCGSHRRAAADRYWVITPPRWAIPAVTETVDLDLLLGRIAPRAERKRLPGAGAMP